MDTTKPHYSLDIETLGLGARAVVLSVGVCMFTPGDDSLTTRHLLLRLDVEDQLRRGRTMTTSTVDWWLSHQEAYRWTRGLALQLQLPLHLNYPVGQAHVTGALDLEDGIALLRNYFHHESGVPESDVVWVNGPAFDAALVQSLHEDAGKECPVRYNAWHDVRTLRRVVRLTDEERATVPAGLEHDALSDAVAQAGYVRLALRKLGVEAE